MKKCKKKSDGNRSRTNDVFMKLKRIDQNLTSGKEEYGRKIWETLLWDDRSGTQEEGVQNVRGIRGVGAETGGGET